MGSTAAGYIALALTTHSAISGAHERKIQAREARHAERDRQKQADIVTQRERIKQVRLARIKRAQAAAAATVSGGTGGSGLIGVQSNVQQQLGSNLSFLDQNQAISAEISRLNISGINHANNAAQADAIGGIASSIFMANSGYKSLFDGAASTPAPKLGTPNPHG